jgi:hypothetical protein
LHLRAYFSVNPFGGYATPRKHEVFSRLALNSYENFKVEKYVQIMYNMYMKEKQKMFEKDILKEIF